MSATSQESKSKKAARSPLFGRRDNQMIGLVFVAPFLVGFFLVFIKLFVSGLRFAFSEVSIQDGLQQTFVGWNNFYYALRVDPLYVETVKGELQTLLTTIPIILIFSLFVAVVLNKQVWGRTAFRAIFFLPVIVSTGLLSRLDSGNYVMSVMTSAAVETDATTALGGLASIGDISVFLQQLEFSPALIKAVAQAAANVMDIINRSGVQILIFLAGIQSISPSIYESANVEGATSWEIFWKITLPMVSPMLVVNVVYTVIECLTRDNTTLIGYVNNMAFSKGQYGYAAAMAWMYFLLVAVLLVILVLIVRKMSLSAKRDR